MCFCFFCVNDIWDTIYKRQKIFGSVWFVFGVFVIPMKVTHTGTDEYEIVFFSLCRRPYYIRSDYFPILEHLCNTPIENSQMVLKIFCVLSFFLLSISISDQFCYGPSWKSACIMCFFLLLLFCMQRTEII